MSLSENNSQIECCICFELMEINYNKFFNCTHSDFHNRCILKCDKCPLCRAPYNVLEDINNVKIIVAFINNLIKIIFLNSVILTTLFIIFH